MTISINPAGAVPSAPLWGNEVNPRVAAQISSEIVVSAALDGLEAKPGSGHTRSPGADRGGISGQIPVQAGEPDFPLLPTQPVAARAPHGIDRAGTPPEDWFESSMPAKEIADARGLEPPAPAPLLHADLKVSARLDGVAIAGASGPGQQLSANPLDARTVPVQPLTMAATSEAVVAKAAIGWHRADWPGTRVDDQLMDEIPLLIAPAPVAPQPSPVLMRFKAVVVNGLLMLGAVVAAVLVATLSRKDLGDIAVTGLAALVVIGALFLILRWARRLGE